MAIDQGMNVDEVRALAESLQKACTDLRAHIAAIEKLVGRAGWLGASGGRFKSEWWPQHRRVLTSAVNDLQAFGQSARSNLSEQMTASSVSGAGSTDGRSTSSGGIDWRETVDGGLFLAGKMENLHDFIGGFSSLRQLEGWSGLFKHADKMKIGPISAIGTGWDMFKLFDGVAAGDTDRSIRAGIDVGFDIASVAFPVVGLGKGAWDVGYQVGKGIGWVFGEKLGGHQSFINSVIDNSYGGTLTPQAAADLSHRYDGWSGFGTFVGDNVANTANSAKSLWKSVFG